MKQDKKFAEGPNRGTSNGKVTYSPTPPKYPKHGDEWIDPVDFSDIPATSTSTGTAGQFAADANYLYVCYAANSWFRIAKDGTW